MTLRLPVGLSLLAAAPLAHGAGHFDIDDAFTLDPGQCQVEVWNARVRSEQSALWHVGPACRIGPFQVNLNAERFSFGDTQLHTLGPQLKWTFLGQEPDALLIAALSASVIYEIPGRGRAGGQFVVPVTWRATNSLMVHVNLGADWATETGQRSVRGGVNGEWTLNDTWSLVGERSRAFDLWTSRVGVRYNFTPNFRIDASAARTGPGRVRGVVVGLNYEFAR